MPDGKRPLLRLLNCTDVLSARTASFSTLWHRYLLFDATTSLGWDTGRAVTNFVCILLVGPGALHGRGGEAITVDNANRLQGSEYDVVLVLHPLSGRREATAFHLESGRLCVLTSRHRHACIVVARAGIQELLDA